MKLTSWRRGVWVGKDIEIVRTNKVQILFRKDPASPEGLWSELSLLRYSESGFEEDVRGIVYANERKRTLKVHVKDLWSRQKEEPYISDPELSRHAIRRTFKMMSCGDDEVLLQADDGQREVIGAEGRIERFDRSGSLVYALKRIEEFEVKHKGIISKKLSESTIAECLRSWSLGTHLIKEDDVTKGIEINTNHHMYIFYVRDDMCYCRAARYETCEKGMIFAQNIRLMVNPQQFMVFMIEDNERVSQEKLIIDETLFDPNACVFTPPERGGWPAGIYWSVKSASDDLIELHGCAGEVYRYERPKPEEASDIIEWIY